MTYLLGIITLQMKKDLNFMNIRAILPEENFLFRFFITDLFGFAKLGKNAVYGMGHTATTKKNNETKVINHWLLGNAKIENNFICEIFLVCAT